MHFGADKIAKRIAKERVQAIKREFAQGDYSLGDYFMSLLMNDPIALAMLEAAQAEADSVGQPYLRAIPLEGRRLQGVDGGLDGGDSPARV